VVLVREQLTANSTTSTGDDSEADNVALKNAVDAVPGARLLRVDNLNHISSSQVRAYPSVAEMQEQNMVVPAVSWSICVNMDCSTPLWMVIILTEH
jgi:hypothetical protein